MGRSKPNHTSHTLLDAVYQMLAHHGLTQRYRQAMVRVAWRTLPLDVVKHTKAVYLKDQIVRVVLNHALLRHSLQSSKARVLAHLREHTGFAITDLIFC